MTKAIPVILDTDIGTDIDDTWALALLLKCPELDPRLILSTTGDTLYRAKIVAKFLERNGRPDIPVGIGLPGQFDGTRELQKAWVGDYSLEKYPGPLFQDGIGAMTELIRDSSDDIRLIAIGPMTNIAEMLRRAPGITKNIHLVAMMGSIAKNHRDAAGAIAEFNVAEDIAAAQSVFDAEWKSITITPLDTCGSVILDGPSYQRLLSSKTRLMQELVDNFRLWAKQSWFKGDPEKETSILYDTVAIHLAFSTEFLRMEEMRLGIDSRGFMQPRADGVKVNVAIAWKDLDAYKDHLVQRLLCPL